MNSLAKALKNKVTNKVGSVLAAPKVAIEGAKSRAADKRYGVVMDRRAMRASGVDMSTSANGRKLESAYQTIKNK